MIRNDVTIQYSVSLQWLIKWCNITKTKTTNVKMSVQQTIHARRSTQCTYQIKMPLMDWWCKITICNKIGTTKSIVLYSHIFLFPKYSCSYCAAQAMSIFSLIWYLDLLLIYMHHCSNIWISICATNDWRIYECYLIVW